ncbi:GPO family capsid scaffolding protein [Pasteurellaceae bacterium TAE3-ERU1]|nr:GPO family capsid scaffolding protein [Pasteurellaceae bacterium TAE3-ERU1]
MMSKTELTTDFISVALSGRTVDGREIHPEWLEQAAEQYDPELYGANIYFEHYRGLGSFGTVQALQAKKDGGKVRLYAKISPTPELLELNQRGQKQYTSVEIIPQFADTGKAYLVGLGITDSPASLGTTRLQFSSRINESAVISDVQEFNLGLDATTELSPAEQQSLFKRFLNFSARLFGDDTQASTDAPEHFSHNNNNNNEELTMTKDEITAAVTTAVAAAFAAQKQAIEAKPAEPAKDEQAEKFAALEKALQDTNAQLAQLKQDFAAAVNTQATQEPSGKPLDDNNYGVNMAV